MKRFYLAVVLLVTMMGLCAYSFVLFNTTSHQMLALLDGIEKASDAGESESEVTRLCQEFVAVWERKEEKLSRFIRHPQLDEITSKSAELPYLAADESNRSHLLATIASIRVNILRVGSSEAFFG